MYLLFQANKEYIKPLEIYLIDKNINNKNCLNKNIGGAGIKYGDNYLYIYTQYNPNNTVKEKLIQETFNVK
jgi:hypothetical protein